MADNRKYYYLKLKESYFDDDSIVLLESIQDGVLYSNILLKLYLKSLKHGGRLQLDEDIPYTAQMIATITRQQIGTVERALQIFLKLGLVELLDSGAYYMSNIELLIGQSSTEGERKRAARQQNRAFLSAWTSGGHLSDIRPPEIELEKEIEREKRDKPPAPLIVMKMCFWRIRSLPSCKQNFLPTGKTTLKNYLLTWPLPASGIRATPLLSGAGPPRTAKRPLKAACCFAASATPTSNAG